MKKQMMCGVWVGMVLVVLCLGAPVVAGELRAWGSDYDRQVSNLPAGTDYVAIAAGDAHGLALRADGSVIAWGQNDDGECDVPAGAYTSIGAGADFSLAIRTDGSIAAWGNDAQGQVSRVPLGSDFVAVEGGEFFAVALKRDGSIVAWGNDTYGQVSGAPRGTSFLAVVAGDAHAVALRADGSLASWGYSAAIDGMPTSGAFTAISAGGNQCVAVHRDGSIVWWGDDYFGYGLADVPVGSDYVNVAAGYLHCLALRQDGSVVGWGAGTDTSSHPHWGQADPPAGTGYAAITCGLYFSLGLTGRAGGTGISDDFDDDRRSDVWLLLGDDLAHCWLDETNRRLELRATAKAWGISARYAGNEWHIDPAGDFSLRVDFHYGLFSDQPGQVSVGLATDVDSPGPQYAVFSAGCDGFYSYFRSEAADGLRMHVTYAERFEDDGVLYVSYDATLDELYFSNVGYGSENAWVTIPGLLQGSWGAQPVQLTLGGRSDGLGIDSGDAYLDNFVLETGNLVVTGLRDVYRFWAPAGGRHFYTISEREKNKLIDKYSRVWTFEGPVYKAAPTPFLPGLAPVYRFWSEKGQAHFYTIRDSEKDKLINKFNHVWRFEGVAFYAYPEGWQSKEVRPVYRFWKPEDNTHFYTISEREKQKLIDKFPKVYAFEGVAFYAYEL